MVDKPGGASLVSATLTDCAQQIKDVLSRTLLGGQPPNVVNVKSNNGLDLFFLFKEIVRHFGCNEQRLRLRQIECFTGALASYKKTWQVAKMIDGRLVRHTFKKTPCIVLPPEVEDKIFSFMYGPGNRKTWIAGDWIQFPRTSSGATVSVRRQGFSMTIGSLRSSRREIVEQLIKWECNEHPETDRTRVRQLPNSLDLIIEASPSQHSFYNALFVATLMRARATLKLGAPYTIYDKQCSYIFRAYGSRSFNKIQINATCTLEEIIAFFDAHMQGSGASHSLRIYSSKAEESGRYEIDVFNQKTTLRDIYACRPNPIPFQMSTTTLFSMRDCRDAGVCMEITRHSQFSDKSTALFLVNLAAEVKKQKASGRRCPLTTSHIKVANESVHYWSANRDAPSVTSSPLIDSI